MSESKSGSVYKVVRVEGPVRVSSTYLYDAYELRYGRFITKPRVGRIFVFLDYTTALEYLNSLSLPGVYELWRATGFDIAPQKNMCIIQSQFVNFWGNLYIDGTVVSAIPGTFTCASIRLLSRITTRKVL